ncbi:antitoxin VbhA family protein [Lysinibacillus xylanilyticus]|uniref:Antitoxin VbhA family protein n=1 Tax=Lysinibacillus xylanilyticus TaxID=582475 RepID=A0ABV3VYK9_9BACI
MRKYSIANTTREERAKRLAQAEAINSLGAKPVAPEDQELFQRHIDGELEIEEVGQMLINKYQKSPKALND